MGLCPQAGRLCEHGVWLVASSDCTNWMFLFLSEIEIAWAINQANMTNVITCVCISWSGWWISCTQAGKLHKAVWAGCLGACSILACVGTDCTNWIPFSIWGADCMGSKYWTWVAQHGPTHMDRVGTAQLAFVGFKRFWTLWALYGNCAVQPISNPRWPMPNPHYMDGIGIRSSSVPLHEVQPMIKLCRPCADIVWAKLARATLWNPHKNYGGYARACRLGSDMLINIKGYSPNREIWLR